MLWPGLNAPIVKGQEVLKQRKLDPNPEYEAQLVKLRDQVGIASRISVLQILPLMLEDPSSVCVLFDRIYDNLCH